MATFNSFILEEEINNILSKHCVLEESPNFKSIGCEAHIIAKCSKKVFAIRYKGYDPFLSSVSEMKRYAEEYEDKIGKVIPILIFVGKRALDYVQDFADELGIRLVPIKKKKLLKKLDVLSILCMN